MCCKYHYLEFLRAFQGLHLSMVTESLTTVQRKKVVRGQPSTGGSLLAKWSPVSNIASLRELFPTIVGRCSRSIQGLIHNFSSPPWRSISCALFNIYWLTLVGERRRVRKWTFRFIAVFPNKNFPSEWLMVVLVGAQRWGLHMIAAYSKMDAHQSTVIGLTAGLLHFHPDQIGLYRDISSWFTDKNKNNGSQKS